MHKLLIAPFAALVLAVPALAVAAPSAAAAAAPNPCKIVTTQQISQVFGGADVSKGKAGLKTPVSVQCKYTVASTADLPEGVLVVQVMYLQGKAAYDGIKNVPDYVPTTGLSKSIYNAKLSVVDTLKGDTLLGMQGLFTGDSLPVTETDVQAQLVALSKLGLKKV